LLEATNAYIGWKAATEKMEIAKERFDRSQQMAKLLRETAPTARIPYHEIVRSEALAGKAQGDYVTAVFEHIKSLLRLQRVTAGGVIPAFPSK
jgi:hypothetical protein